ncbi:hypothetical protein BBP40_003264 [Aspergillus hancockii]|nr:hypothetical protein BBP40_003264 [Aspergillus hancockii]
MPANFLSLPGELRNEIYSYVLLREDLIDPCWLGDCGLELNVLRTNKTVYKEAKSLLYGQNHFDFTACSSHTIARFIDRIGHDSANHIQHVRIDFPVHRYLDDEDGMEEDSCRTLEKIQSGFTNLRTLATSPRSKGGLEPRLGPNGGPEIVTEVLAEIDAHFRAISSLQEIIVEVYKDGISDFTRMEMESHGWVIRVVEGEWDERSWGDFEDDDRFYSDDYDVDDYDIDNDSDFWRRAAD